MKRILLIAFLFLSIGAFSQPTTTPVRVPQNALYKDVATGYYWTSLIGGIYIRNLQFGDTVSMLATQYYVNTHSGSNISAFTVSSLPVIGQVISAGSPDNVAHQLGNQSQSPTASLTGGTLYELTVSNQTHNLSWTYGRQAATLNITTAVINPGSFNVFSSQPSQPGSLSGIQSVTTTANVNTTYTITVTTSDSKTATSSTTDTFLPRLYYGRSVGSSPTTTEILAFAGGNNPLTASHAIGPVTITASGSGSKWPFFTYPASEGFVTIIK